MMNLPRTARLLVVLLSAALPVTALAGDMAIKAELPVLVTSSGQALDAFTVKTLLGRAGVDTGYDPRAEIGKLDGVKTLVIAMGASVKGFGAAGVTADTEISRTRELLKLARERKILTIGVHIGGAARRDKLSMQFVDLVSPAVDYLMVWKDGNADGYFDAVASKGNIPLTVLDLPLEVGKKLAGHFSQ